jgi:hypothetical protein
MSDFPKVPESGDIITFTDYRTHKVTQGEVIETTTNVILVSMWNEDGTGGYLWVPWLDIIVERQRTFRTEAQP